MDRKLIAGTLLLLSLQAALLVSGWPYDKEIRSGEPREMVKPIGFIVEKRQGVKRRPHNSVVWEESEASDALLSYDNVLTLDHSSAELNLNGDVHIDLHENTLIVIEPPTASAPDLVHIRFAHGQLVGMSGQHEFGVATENWQIEARSGSNLSLKALDGDKVEIEVRSGEIQLKNANDSAPSQRISTGTRFSVDKQQIFATAQIRPSLRFEQPREVHVYTHGEQAAFRPIWVGEAQKIVDAPPAAKKTEYLVSNQQSTELLLPVGTHYLSLLSSDGAVSSEMIVDVIPAPRIRYTTPLPRDRFEFGHEVAFGWLPLEGAKKYVLEVEPTIGSKDGLIAESHEAPQSNLKCAPKSAGEARIKVYGVDSGGFKIPPQDSLPLYFVRDPLAAPKLLTPKVREPATLVAPPKPPAKTHGEKTSWLKRIWDELWPVARADENLKSRQIEFNWEPVPGADFYNLEISSTPDFAAPEIMVKVEQEMFAWSQFKKQIYYWRVAAGVTTGRMGLFSEVTQFDLSKIDSLGEGEIAPGVVVANKLPTQKTKAPPTAAKELKPELGIKTEAVPPKKTWRFEKSFELDMLYRTSSADTKDFSASLGGFANASAGLWLSAETDTGALFQSQLRYSQVNWQPANTTTLPYQQSWTDSEFALRFWRESKESEWGWGFLAETVQILERTAHENIHSSTYWQFGPAFSYHVLILEDLQFHTSNGLLYGGNAVGISTANVLNYTRNKWWHQPYLGGDLELKLYFGSGSYSGFDLTTGFHLGLRF